MLCLLFTRKKLFCGFANQDFELLHVQGRNFLELNGHSPEALIKEHLQEIAYAYRQMSEQKQGSSPEKIQTVIAFPKNFTQLTKSEDETSQVLKRLEEVAGNELDVLTGAENSLAYLSGIKKDSIPAEDAPRIVIDSLDDKVSVYYQGLNGKAAENGKSKVVYLEGLGLEEGRNHVVETLVKSFNQIGVSLDEKDLEDLRQQVRNPMRNGTFTLVKSNDLVSVTAKANMPEEQFIELLTQERASLKPYLEEKSLDELGIQDVVVMGPFIKNPIFKDYMEKDLHLEGKRILGADLKGELEDIVTIAKGLGKIGLKELQERIEEERLKREAAERERLKEIQLQADRDALMMEIREKCLDESQKEVYETHYVERGEKVGLPKEVVLWNIQEALRIARLTPSKPPETELFSQSTSLIQAPNNWKESIIQEVPEEEEGETSTASSVSLKELFEIRGVLPDSEFNTKKVFEKQSKTVKVVRILPENRIQDPEWNKKFEKLYEKELTYYGELSDIRMAQEGKYFTRPYYERSTLKDYVRKAELFNKKGIEQLGSNELKLILQVMKEINDAQVSHADLNENNILVISRRKWGLQKEIQIKLVGFTSEEVSKEVMEIQFHEMWERLLGKGFYAEFRNKFSL